MKEIQISGARGRGLVAIVDDEDFEWLSEHRWFLHSGNQRSKTNYCYCSVYMGGGHSAGTRRLILTHRAVLDARPGVGIDHVNGNGLDNRKCNLRFATQAENTRWYFDRIKAA